MIVARVLHDSKLVDILVRCFTDSSAWQRGGAAPMPVRKGLLAPQNTFLDTIATRFDGTRKYIRITRV